MWRSSCAFPIGLPVYLNGPPATSQIHSVRMNFRAGSWPDAFQDALRVAESRVALTLTVSRDASGLHQQHEQRDHQEQIGA